MNNLLHVHREISFSSCLFQFRIREKIGQTDDHFEYLDRNSGTSLRQKEKNANQDRGEEGMGCKESDGWGEAETE